MTQVIDLRHVAAVGELAEDVAAALTAGHLVGLPSETRYLLACSAASADAVERLIAARPDASPEDFALLIPHQESLQDFVTHLPRSTERLLRRCWPGPVVVRAGSVAGHSFHAFPSPTRRLLADAGVPICVPAFLLLRRVAEGMAPPVLTVAARLPAGRTWNDSDGLEVARIHGQDLETVYDSGPPRHPQGPTVIDLTAAGWKLIREGVVPASMMSRLSSLMILFVCTGNTCRSPMAEGLFRRVAADRLGCTVDELADHGFLAQSAGVSAVTGMAAAPETLTILRSANVDLSDHSSQPVTEDLLAQTDYVVAMTAAHLDTLYNEFPEHRPKMRLLSPQRDIGDPIGQGMSVYEACGAEIRQALEAFLDQLIQEREEEASR